MPEPKEYVELPEEIRENLNSVMQPGEALKIQFGTQGRIIFNESSVGKSQNRLEPDHIDVIKNLLDKTDFKRGPVQVKESTGNQKTPQIEITAVTKDDAGKASIRTLLRQERDLIVSVHPADLEVTSPQIESITEPDGRLTVEDRDEAEIDSGASEEPTVAAARPGRSPAPYRILPEAIPQQNIFTPGSYNTLQALERSVDKLSESKTKALWQRVSADFSVIGDTAKRLGKTVTEVPTAIKADTSTLVGQGKQRVEALRQAVSTRIQQTSPEDVMGAAMKGIGIAAAAGSTQLGKASRYLQNRAEKVRDHGMAKSALAVYEKGHERTGERQFKASSYTVEAVTDGFIVRNSQDRPIMSFGTDAKGRPISVTKTNAATLEDIKALNQLSKSDVIKGSPEAERSYEDRARVIALTAQAVVKEKGEAINGKHYFMDVRKDGSLQVLTQTMPERSLEMKPDGSIRSTFTQADLNQMETSIKDTRRAIEQPVKPREQMTV